MTLKSDPNFEERLTFCLKNNMGNLMWFSSSSEKLENLNFDGIFLSKVCNIWIKLIQTICVLKKWLMVSKMPYIRNLVKLMLDKSSAYNVLAEGTYFSDKCIPLNFKFFDFPLLVWSYPNSSYDFWNQEPVFVQILHHFVIF